MITLRDYQQQAIDGVRAEFRRGARAVLMVMPTGSGKTVTFTHIVQGAMAKGSRVLLQAHRRELVRQISEALEGWGVPHALITPDHPPSDLPVQVGMVQTLVRRLPLDRVGRYRFDLIITDEAHHLADGSQWAKVLAHSPTARLLGVTATPARLDGRPLGRSRGGVFDAMVIGPTEQDLIDAGHLCRAVVYGPARAMDLSGVQKRGGEYVAAQLEAAVKKAAITGDAIKHYRRHMDRRPAIAFCVSLAEAGSVAADFRAAGYQATVLSAQTQDRERSRIIRDLGASDGHLHVLVSVDVVSEGTDVPAVKGVILLRPTASLVVYRQQVGRALRPYDGKNGEAIVNDHVGNSLVHGLPAEPVEWSLDADRPAPAGAVAKPCPTCGRVVSISRTRCDCGHRFAVAAPDYQREPREPLDVAQEDLIELDAETLAKQRAAQQRKREDAQAQTLDDLIELGRQRNYHNPRAWAEKKMAGRNKARERWAARAFENNIPPHWAEGRRYG